MNTILITYAALLACILLEPATRGATPFAATQPATRITLTNANLNGMATPNGLPSTAWFEWWTNASNFQVTAPIQVGAGSKVVRVSEPVIKLPAHQPFHYCLVVGNTVGVVKGAEHLFMTGGKLISWDPYCGWGHEIPPPTPPPSDLDDIVAVAIASGTRLAVRSDGTLLRWGLGNTGVPASATNIIAIAAGNPNLALREEGTVLSWNDIGIGQLPSGLNNVVAISAGEGHSLALNADGTIIAWGDNSVVQATIPPNLSNVVAVSAASHFNLALRNDGTVVAWGHNALVLPNMLASLRDVVAISAWPPSSFLVLRSDRSVVAWDSGQPETTPVPANWTNIVAIFASNFALRSDGTPLERERCAPAGAGNIFAIGGMGLALGANRPPYSYPREFAFAFPGTTNVLFSLHADDVNHDTLNYRVTSIPSGGTLYQIENGNQGPPITAAQTLLTDPKHRLLFVPHSNDFGEASASFTFVENDGYSDSLPVTITFSSIPFFPQVRIARVPWDPSWMTIRFAETNPRNYQVLVSTNLQDWRSIGITGSGSAGAIRCFRTNGS